MPMQNLLGRTGGGLPPPPDPPIASAFGDTDGEIFGQKNFRPKILRPNSFPAEKTFGRKKFRPKNVSAEKNFGRKFVRPKKFSTEKNFGRKTFSTEIVFDQRFFRSKKFSSENFAVRIAEGGNDGGGPDSYVSFNFVRTVYLT